MDLKIAAVAFLGILASASAAGQMYKCLDAQGITHYADKPTPGCKNAPVDIRGSPPISGRLAPRPDDTAQQEADFRRRQAERERSEETARAQRAELERRCASLRAEHAVLASGRRLVQFDAQGERMYVDDGERQRRLAEVQAALQQCP